LGNLNTDSGDLVVRWLPMSLQIRPQDGCMSGSRVEFDQVGPGE
jgi:hypothetical protein